MTRPLGATHDLGLRLQGRAYSDAPAKRRGVIAAAPPFTKTEALTSKSTFRVDTGIPIVKPLAGSHCRPASE